MVLQFSASEGNVAGFVFNECWRMQLMKTMMTHSTLFVAPAMVFALLLSLQASQAANRNHRESSATPFDKVGRHVLAFGN